MATKYKKPDLNAPRYRPKKLNLSNKEVHKEFISQNPRFGSLTATQFKEVIKQFNGMVWQHVIDSRDGVELPEQLGFLLLVPAHVNTVRTQTIRRACNTA